MNLNVTMPCEVTPGRFREFEVSLPDGLARVYVLTDTDGNPEYGMPFRTTVTVAAEVWRDGMDDDGDGEPVTTPEGLAALLGCEPGEVAERAGERALETYYV